MRYRDVPRLGTRLSTFGMGCMRRLLLADSDGASSKIDEARVNRMVHHTLDNGVNCVDTGKKPSLPPRLLPP